MSFSCWSCLVSDEYTVSTAPLTMTPYAFTRTVALTYSLSIFVAFTHHPAALNIRKNNFEFYAK